MNQKKGNSKISDRRKRYREKRRFRKGFPVLLLLAVLAVCDVSVTYLGKETGEKTEKCIEKNSESISQEADTISKSVKNSSSEKNANSKNADFANTDQKKQNSREPSYQKGHVLILFKQEAGKKNIKDILEKENLSYEKMEKVLGAYYMVNASIPKGKTEDQVIKELREYEQVETADRNEYAEPAEDIEPTEEIDTTEDTQPKESTGNVNDLRVSEQWYLDDIHVQEAWDIVSNSEHHQVVVAVMDSGIQLDHPDLENVLLTDKAVDVYEESKPIDSGSVQYNGGHGTWVAGCIAAEANNNLGTAGVASSYTNDIVRIIPVKICSNNADDTSCSKEAFVRGVSYCMDQGVDIINYSYYGMGEISVSQKTAYETVLKAATDNGIIFVTCAGNDNTDEYAWPSDMSDAISAMATTSSRQLASFTNYGMAKDVCAPGEHILTTSIGSTYAYVNGTSFASPITASIAAMMRSIDGSLTNEDVRQILIDTSEDIGIEGKCKGGLVNAAEAVEAVESSLETRTILNQAEVTGVTAQATDFNSITVNWTSENVREDCTYNIYIDNVKVKEALNENTYQMEGISSGNRTVRVTASYNGIETKGKECSVYVFDNKSLETLNVAVDSKDYNAITVSWEADELQEQSGCTYNIYIDNIKTRENVTSGVYQFEDIDYGYRTIKITASLYGKETEGVEYQVYVIDKNPLEVLNGTAYSEDFNSIMVSWEIDEERKLTGCTYNVYIDDVKVRENLTGNSYQLKGITYGYRTVKITSFLNGNESDGVEYTIHVVDEKPLEVLNAKVYSTQVNSITANWEIDEERMLSGCTYNVYIDGIKLGENLTDSEYQFNNVAAGYRNVKITASLNGYETGGVEFNIYVVDGSPPEVLNATAYSEGDNSITVSWENDMERVLSGCTYNIYIDGVKYRENLSGSSYRFEGISGGDRTVKVTASLNGFETEGTEIFVFVSQPETGESPVESVSEEQETTKESSTTSEENLTTEGITTEAVENLTTEGITTETAENLTTEGITTEAVENLTTEGITTEAVENLTTASGESSGTSSLFDEATNASNEDSGTTSLVDETTVNKPALTTTNKPETTTAKAVVKAPGKAKVKKITKKKITARKLKLTLKKITGAKGYQVAVYKTRKNAKKNKGAIVKKLVKKVKPTIRSKKLKNRKALYVKVRAYVLNGKTKVYGKWSKVKKIKIKR